MNQVLEEILKTKQVISPDGANFKLHSEISPKEGKFIQDIILKYKPQRTLEIGLAYGISSLYMCEILGENPRAQHVIIDPCQNSLWNNVGLYNLKRSGYSGMVEFFEEYSWERLPKLLKDNYKFDLAFIDGSHSFENVMLDFYYVSRMLTVGGVIIFDDADMPTVRKACRFILNNFKYRVVANNDQSTQYRSWKWKAITLFKNIFPKLGNDLLKPEINIPDFAMGRYSSCVVIVKEAMGEEKEDFQDF